VSRNDDRVRVVQYFSCSDDYEWTASCISSGVFRKSIKDESVEEEYVLGFMEG